MPPEQFPWDRRDFRKHDRSGSDPRFGGGGGFGGGWTHRWREPQHHPHALPSFQHHYNHQPQQSWYPDFRTSRPIPPGHDKQGGWNMYPDEDGPVLMPFGSRYGDRDVSDDNFRPFESRGDTRYLRNNRDSRGSVSQKDWRSHSWEPAVSSSGPGRPTTEANNQKAIETTKANNPKAMGNAQTCHKANIQKSSDNAQSCNKVSNQKAVENGQICQRVNNQKAGENAQTCHKMNFLKTVENTLAKVNNEKAVENTPDKVNNEKTVENTPTKVNTEKAVENTPIQVNNEKAMENTLIKVNHEKSVENTQTCQKNDSVKNDSVHPLPYPLSSPSQPLPIENPEKNDAAAGTLVSSGQNPEIGNGLGSIGWKPMKWSRSGSLVSRGSGFCHSSSSKSLGVDSTDIIAGVQKDVMPVKSPAACAMPSALDPSDDTISRKKRRLGWGEGLAKYEKKKVDGDEEDATKGRLFVGVASTETMQSPRMSQVDKSPRFANMLDCASPGTPASVACSSSPGITGGEEKESVKAASGDYNTADLSCSPGIVPQIHHEWPSFNLENLDLSSITNLSSLLNDLLQSNDRCSVESCYGRTTSLNKLLICKVDMLKALEVTESDIDSLETELKSLSAGSNGCHPCPASYSSQSGECLLEPFEEHAATSGYTAVPAPLLIASAGNMVDVDTPAALEVENVEVKDEEIDSPGTATSNLAGALSSREDTCTSKTTECVEGFFQLDLNNSNNLNQVCSENCSSDQDNMCLVDAPNTILSNCQNFNIVGNVHHDHIYDSILDFNKESATRSVEELNKLLPGKMCAVDDPCVYRASHLEGHSLMIKDRFLARKWSCKFKEKVITLKFRVFQHFWKEGRVVSVRKLRGKAHKMFDLGWTGYRKNRSSSQSRISCFAGSHPVVPAVEVIEFINGLLSASPFKPCRNSLKMPCFILDKEIRMSRFITNNGLVEDPGAAEKERPILNPWTAEEREIFIDKLAVYGKSFSKIASFLEHKTIADCVEFYYKNRKSECFERARKKPDKQSKPQPTTYLVATRKRSSRDVNAVNLDILGDALIMAGAVNDGEGTQQPKPRSRILLDADSSRKIPRGGDGTLQRSNSLDMYSNETAAADVLAGICGSLSSEAMSSCITSSFDLARAGSSIKRPLTPDVTQNVADECSDESCAEIDTTDWTDEEKSLFIQAMSSYGKDFAMISQCVGTKTMGQCKIFFSKARKCLGLDQISPGGGSVESGDVDGGGSDVEGCVVQNRTVICNDDYENKIEENLIPHVIKMDHTSDTAESHKLKPEVNVCLESNRTYPLDSRAISPVFENSSGIGYPVDDKPVIDVNASDSVWNGANDSERGVRTTCVSSNSNSQQVKLGVDCGLPGRSSETDNKALGEVPDGLVQGNLDIKKVGYRDADFVDVAFSSAASELKPERQLVGHVSHPSAYLRSLQVESALEKDADLESRSTEASCVISSLHNDHVASVESCTLFSLPIKYQTHAVGDTLPNVGISGADTKYFQSMTGDSQQLLLGSSRPEPIEPSQILRGYPVPVHAMKDLNVDVNSQKLALPQEVPIRDGMLHLDRHTDLPLQMCTGSRHPNEVFKVPCPSQDQCYGDKSRFQSGCMPGLEPSRNGDVKLFGKILVSSKQEPTSSTRDSGPENTHHHKTGGQLLNLKLSGDDKAHLHSSKPKFDCNNYLGTENIPVGSFGLWDCNKMQNGFPLLDSTLLLNKYPAAFANHSIPSAKLEQPPLHRVSKSNDQPLNGFSVIPRELSSNIGLPEYPVLRNRELQQPLAVDMRQPQDVVFSEMQRRSGFGLMTEMQQQARMMAGINNVVGGMVFNSDQYHPGASNPGSDFKMHYGSVQNLNMQARGMDK